MDMEIKVYAQAKIFCMAHTVDRLGTKAMLTRRNYPVEPNVHCVLCDGQVEEDILHLFFTCPFASSCWQKIGVLWDPANDIHDKVINTMNQLQLPFFIEIVIVVAWKFGIFAMGLSSTGRELRYIFGL
jgi:hypothetical protein